MSDIIRDITEIARCGAQYKADSLAVYGLKGCHASYLTEICANPGISQDQLAQKICINKSNVARQATILEEDGFITRTPAPTAATPHGKNHSAAAGDHCHHRCLGTLPHRDPYGGGDRYRRCHFGADASNCRRLDGKPLKIRYPPEKAPTGIFYLL